MEDAGEFCFYEGALLATPSGLVSIAELAARAHDQYVFTFRGSGVRGGRIAAPGPEARVEAPLRIVTIAMEDCEPHGDAQMARRLSEDVLVSASNQRVARAVHRATFQAFLAAVASQPPYEWVEARELKVGDFVQSISMERAFDPFVCAKTDMLWTIKEWRKIVHIAAGDASCRARKISMASSDPCVFANGVLVRCAAMV